MHLKIGQICNIRQNLDKSVILDTQFRQICNITYKILCKPRNWDNNFKAGPDIMASYNVCVWIQWLANMCVWIQLLADMYVRTLWLAEWCERTKQPVGWSELALHLAGRCVRSPQALITEQAPRRSFTKSNTSHLIIVRHVDSIRTLLRYLTKTKL